jgi:DUF2075 family protein
MANDLAHKKVKYRGFSIETEGGLWQVRWHQKNPDLTHVWRPWCDSIKEAKSVVDKLLEEDDPRIKPWERG